MANGVGPPGAVRLAAGGVVLRAFEDGDVAAHAQLIGRGFAHLHPWPPWVTEGHGEEWQWALAAADWTPRIGPGQTG